MCLKIFVYGDQEKYNALEGPAIHLGSAFQKVNFLRDLKADKEKLHRTYFSDLTQGDLDEKVKAHLVEDIEYEFAEAKKGIRSLPGRERFGVLVAYLYYIRLLHKLKHTPASRIMNERIRVNDFSKFILLIQAYILYKFRLV
jgi:phytoene/squalene synthetase